MFQISSATNTSKNQGIQTKAAGTHHEQLHWVWRRALNIASKRPPSIRTAVPWAAVCSWRMQGEKRQSSVRMLQHGTWKVGVSLDIGFLLELRLRSPHVLTMLQGLRRRQAMGCLLIRQEPEQSCALSQSAPRGLFTMDWIITFYSRYVYSVHIYSSQLISNCTCIGSTRRAWGNWVPRPFLELWQGRAWATNLICMFPGWCWCCGLRTTLARH